MNLLEMALLATVVIVAGAVPLLMRRSNAFVLPTRRNKVLVIVWVTATCVLSVALLVAVILFGFNNWIELFAALLALNFYLPRLFLSWGYKD